jgi:hypothetical protein
MLDISRYLFVNAMTTVSASCSCIRPKTTLASVAIVNLDEAGDIGAASAMATLVVVTSATVCFLYFLLQRFLERRTQSWRTFMIRGNDPILLTPGPLTTSLETKQAMLRDWGSWDASFNCDHRFHLQGPGRRRPWRGDALCASPLQGSGTFSVEAALSNVVPRGGKVLVPQNGALLPAHPQDPEVHRARRVSRSTSPRTAS